MNSSEIKTMGRQRYGDIAEAAAPSCCAPAASCCAPTTPADAADKARAMGYSEVDLSAVPDGANLGLGCGNPQGIAAIRPGEAVIDLGSGAGFERITVTIKPQSRDLIATWAPGQGIENFVVSSFIEARKP